MGLSFSSTLFALLIAGCIAIRRYRLWDIDLIIRKTLVYSILTGLLALIYFGGVVLLQQLIRSATASSDLAIVVSTLIIAALFFPLRQRVQTRLIAGSIGANMTQPRPSRVWRNGAR